MWCRNSFPLRAQEALQSIEALKVAVTRMALQVGRVILVVLPVQGMTSAMKKLVVVLANDSVNLDAEQVVVQGVFLVR